jgi:hypothetical protein
MFTRIGDVLPRCRVYHSLFPSYELIWKDFNKEFDETLNNFRNHDKNVEKEASLSNMIEAQSTAIL